MNPPARSYAYRFAQWQLSFPGLSKPYIAGMAGFGLYQLGTAIWDERLRTLTVACGVLILAGAWWEWELRGFRKIIEEQKRLAATARSSETSVQSANTEGKTS